MTNWLDDEKAYEAIDKEVLKRLNFFYDNLYEAESVKSEVEHKEPIIVGFFILQYAKLRMVDAYYIFSYELCEFSPFEQMKMHTVILYLVLAHFSSEKCKKNRIERKLEDCPKQRLQQQIHG